MKDRSSIHSLGIGYITIPVSENRSNYISSCFRKERISIQLDDRGTVIQNCYISKNLISELVFPNNSFELGSPVVYIVPGMHNIPIIVGVLNKPGETQLLDEHIYKKVIFSDAGSVSVELKPEGGIFIDVNSNFEDEGNIFITLKSKNNSAKFNLSCFGDIDIYSEGDSKIESLGNISLKKSIIDNNIKIDSSSIEINESGFFYRDRFGNSVNFNDEGKIVYNDGDSPIPKGDELLLQLNNMKATIDTFIDVYLQTVQTIILDAGSTAKASMETALELVRDEDFSKINSKRSFIK